MKGDLVIGWFKPLQMPAGAEPTREIYIMITNGLCDRTAIASDCRQRITVNLHFLDTGITSLQRLSRATGKVEQVELKPVGEAGRHFLTFELDAGTGDLFKFNTGAAFVGRRETAAH